MTKKAIIKIQDEINALLIGLDGKAITTLFEHFGLFTGNHFFSPKFKLGIWDGKIRFFSKTGQTYVQLLPEIIPILKKLGWTFELIDNRKSWVIDIPPIDKNYLSAYPDPKSPDKPLELGEHQVKAINIATQNNIGMIIAGTGAGKTIVTAALCSLYKNHAKFKCIVIVPTSDLVEQTRAGIGEYGNDVGQYDGIVKEINHDHLVSTWQALQNNPKLVALYQVVIVDECHGVKGTVIRDIINNSGGNIPVKIGLTGTLPKDPCDVMNIRISLGNVLYTIPASELIAKGWLAALKLRIINLIEDLKEEWEAYKLNYPVEASKLTYKKFKKEFFPDYNSEKSYLKKNQARNEFIANLVDMARVRGNCLVLTNGIPFGKKLAGMIPDAYFVYGKDDKKVRKEIYDLFKTHNDIVVVTNYQIASTGLDIPRIFNLFLIDPGNSFIRVIQSIGRGLRKASDKDTIFVYDIASDLAYSHDHMLERRKYYNEQQYKFNQDDIDYINIDLT